MVFLYVSRLGFQYLKLPMVHHTNIVIELVAGWLLLEENTVVSEGFLEPKKPNVTKNWIFVVSDCPCFSLICPDILILNLDKKEHNL